VLFDAFIPVDEKITTGGGRSWDWHTAGRRPAVEDASLIVFGLQTAGDQPSFEVCRAMNQMEWDTADFPAVHLGILRLDMSLSTYAQWFAGLMSEIRRLNARAPLLIYVTGPWNAALLAPLAGPSDWLSFFRSRLPAGEHDPLNELLQHHRFGHLAIGGLQTFYTGKRYRNLMSFPQVDIWRLSDLREQSDLTDVMLRQARLAVVSYEVLAFGTTVNSRLGVAGMDIYEWASIFYHAGLSPVLRTLMVVDFSYGDYPRRDAEAVALGIWHMYEGIKNKTEDFPFIEKKKLQRTEMTADQRQWPVFLNPMTGRWWIDVGNGRSQMVPVTGKTVEKLRGGNAPLHLLKYFL